MNKLNKNTIFSYTSKYLTKNGEPWFPIMGEFHYSRFPEQYWKEALYKMKSGGVEIVSSYVIWIHHEEIENEYDFSGRRNLRAFLQAALDCGLYIILRIGPWCHGEVRNGGFPDWLLRKNYKVRTNDPGYLETVSRFYKRIYREVKGYLIKDGGPVIGVQIENEYGHCGGLTGEAGEEHMRILTRLAKEAGFDVPYYTATGWGGAVTGGLIPVMGGYCEAPWDQRLTEIEPSGNYIFTNKRDDNYIGSDYGFGNGLTFDINSFPFLTAELGGGLQVTKHRRPVATATDIGAMSLVKLGSGANMLGYYMYHGGTNPKGRLTTLQESRKTGYSNDLPELSYDFNAPIREYGQISDTYKEIKLLSMFIKDFGRELCEMQVEIPEDNPLYPTDFIHLRTSIRRKGKSGYLFVNNYQRRCHMAEHLNEKLRVNLEDEVLEYPAVDIYDGDYFFLPFHMPIGNEAEIVTALATPLCKIRNNDQMTYVFYTDKDLKYTISGELRDTHILILTREEAKNALKYEIDGQDYLLISNFSAILEDNKIMLSGRISKDNKQIELKAYPALPSLPQYLKEKGKEGELYVYEGIAAEAKELDNMNASVMLVEDKGTEKKYLITMEYGNLQTFNDCFMRIAYRGESSELYINGEKEADNFYTGQIWEIGLKRFQFPKQVEVVVHQLTEDTPVYLEKWPQMEENKNSVCIIDSVQLQPEIKLRLL